MNYVYGSFDYCPWLPTLMNGMSNSANNSLHVMFTVFSVKLYKTIILLVLEIPCFIHCSNLPAIEKLYSLMDYSLQNTFYRELLSRIALPAEEKIKGINKTIKKLHFDL